MNKTKAAFKAIREECGLSQQDVADEADVTVQSVKKWENPRYEQAPPDDVWRFLLECRGTLYADARELAGEIAASLEVEGGKEVVLDYYRTQEDLDAVQLGTGIDEPVGYHNTRMREIGRILEQMEIPYTYQYGGGQ